MQSLGFFALLLGVLVTVHELGHFLVAKACGVKVLKFSIGFGPKLLGFTKGDTEYQLALLPLGGYVKMAGDVPGEELPPEEANRGFLAQPPWKRMLIVLAGPVFNLAFPVLVYFFVFLGPYEDVSARVGYVAPGSAAAVAGVRPGDRILAVDGEKVRTDKEVDEAFIGRFERPVPLTLERDGKQMIVEVTPLKKVETSPVETVERGVLGAEPYSQLPTLGVPAGSPADQAGLKTFDRILTVNGTFVPDVASLYQLMDRQQGPMELVVLRSPTLEVGAITARAPHQVTVKVDKQPGEGFAALGAEPVDLYIASVAQESPAMKAGLCSGDRLVALNGEPLQSFHLFQVKLAAMEDKPFQLTWRGAEGERTAQVARSQLKGTDALGNTHTYMGVGVVQWNAAAPPELVTLDYSAGEAMGKAVRVVPAITKQTVKAVAGLITRDVPLSSVGGPVMMYQMAAKTSEQGWDSFLQLMAIISINLGVMNLLPIPILDGFHLVAAGWESVRRRPIPVRVREVANVIGLAMLVALMLVAFFNDITR